MEYNKVLKNIYSAWLGKNIGIRFGAPVENWTHEDIKKTYGKINHYVCDYEPCFASDDDANGPFYFAKALDYCCSKDIDALELSKQILNILCEGHGFFWWGGKGIATEHTAYLNLLDDIYAPKSGSEKLNGKMLAEQIGGQIFSDCWGYVAYDDPNLASELAGKMASAMHDGDGIEGAKYIAACISLAFTIKDAYEVVIRGLDYINKDSSYAKLVLEIVGLYDQGYNEEECLKYILENHGYDKYEGVCHILPNTAIMIMALLYGKNDFSKTMILLCNAGWDTDCTLGNVGSIIGALVGVEHIDPTWIIPIKDRFIGSSLIGSSNIDTLSRQAHYFTSLAFKLKGMEVNSNISKNEILFDLPYGIQGFECNSNRYFESNLIQKNNTCTCIINNAFKDNILKIYKKTYYRPCDLYDVRYQPSFSPLVYPNNTICFELNEYENLECRVIAIGKNTYTSEWSKDTHLELRLPANDDCILEIGLEVKALCRIMHGEIQIRKVSYDNNIDCFIDFRKETMNDYGIDYGELQFKEINQCTTLRQNSYVDSTGLHIHNDMVLFGNDEAYLHELEFEGKFDNELEIGFACSGRLNYNCIVLNENEISLKLYKNNRKGFTTARKICKIYLGNFNYVKLSFSDDILTVQVNDQSFKFECIIQKGCLLVHTENNANLSWCKFVMTNSHK